MKFKKLFEDGTTSADIAPVETKLGQKLIKRKDDLDEDVYDKIDKFHNKIDKMHDDLDNIEDEMNKEIDTIINDIDEGFVHPDYIEKNISIAFFNDHHSQESFANCFDIDALKIAVINAYAKRANYSDSMSGLEIFDMNIFEEDATTDEIVFWLNIHCKHHHTWIFKGFAQHNTQVIFGTKTGKRTVVVYQHFPRTIKESIRRK